MKQRDLPTLPHLHVAIIMDGNGRWATARRLPRSAGHRAGATAVRRTVEAATRLGLGTLTLYAFSGDNWRRPPAEVATLMTLFRRYLATERERCVRNGVRLTVIGRRDRLEPSLVAAIEDAERATAGGRALHLRLALDYSARDAIVQAAARLTPDVATREHFAALLGEVTHGGGPAPDVDLVIRTGGDQRLSDFLLWECAYAELTFIARAWPEFGEADLVGAIHDFLHRERRFGALPAAAAAG